MKKFLTHLVIALAVITMSTFTGRLLGQSTTGSIYGTVADSSGAAIPNASVTIRDIHSGVTQSTTTNNSGEYTFPVVNPGDYTVSSTAQGFKTQNQTGVSLSANQNVHVTFALTAGAVTENIDVEAGLTLVDTRESQLGETIDQQRLQDLPTLNRSTYDLVQLMPGVTNYTADTQTGSRDGTKFSVNGMPSDMVSGYIDGAYNDSYKQGGLNKVPNPDALQEFRVLTSNFDAEFGRSPGGVVNVITRSGTQQYHGSAYEYVRNDMFNARNYFQAPGPRQPYKQNQFGGTFGGPVPAVKDTFMFFSYEELILHQTANVNAGTIIVPTDLERKGDFSQSTAKPVLAASAQCGTAQAPVICTAALDPVAQNVLKFVPHSTNGLAPQQTAPANTSSYQGLARLDYNGIHNHSVELMYFNTQGTQIAPLTGGNQIVGYSGMTQSENQANAVLADTWTVSSKLVNSFRAFYTQNKYVIANLYQGHFLADLGSQAGEGGPSYAPPKFTIGGAFSAGASGAGPSNISQLSMGGVDTATFTMGHHSLKAGGSYAWNTYKEDGNATAMGNFTFSNNGSMTGATALSDFLQGKASSLAQSSSVHHRTHQYDPALFVQDDWQLSPRLSLNLGLRWEMFNNHCCEPQIVGNFIANQQSTVISKAPLGLVYIGDKNVAPELFNTSLLTFAPRLGFAYDVYGDGRTSLRGGWGIFYQTVEQFNNGTSNELPFSLNTTINQTPNLVQPYANVSGGDPYPFVYNPSAPRFADNATTQATAQNTGAPYVYEYNLTLEQQLTKTFALRLGYVGNDTHKNIIMIDDNAPVYFPNAANSTAGINCRRPYEPYRTSGGPANTTTCTYGGYTGSGGPDPTQGKIFGAVNSRDPKLDANFNSLQASVRGNLGKHVNITAFYAWAKELDYDTPTVDASDIRKNYGVGALDIRNNFALSYLIHLPNPNFWGPAGRQILGGWQLNGATYMTSGSPYTVISGTDTNRDGNNNDRINITGNPYSGAKSRHDKIYNFYNLSAFSVPHFTLSTDNPYGNEQKNQFVAPRSTRTNVSLFKEFSLYERLKLQIRAEAFNIIGNVNLGAPRNNFSVFSTLPAGGMQITSAGDPRILQFAGKLFF